MRIGTGLLAAAALFVLAEGCASPGGGTETGDRGIRVYEPGRPVYVCREAPVAPTLGELAEELRSGRPERDSPTGQTVRVRERETVEVDGRSTPVARVSATEGDAEYWIPYTALCARGD